MEEPFFSIIVPTLNEEDFLPKLLKNLKKQKEKNFEVIIVDGFSKDNTEKVCLSYIKEIPINFYKVKRSVSFQRNFGATKAKGKYLIFLDADASVSAGFSNSLKKYILKNKGLVLIPYIVPDEKTTEAQFIFKVSNLLPELSHNIGKPFSKGGHMIWEKNFFNLVGGFNEKLFMAEDHNIIEKAQKWGVKVRFLQKIRVKISLRRMRREGRLTMFYKSLLSVGHLLIKGDIKNKIFEYEMGGKTYADFKNNVSFEDNLKNYLKQLKKFFGQYLT